MIDNDSIIEVKQNEISIEAQEDQISTTESITHIVTDGIAPLISSVEEIPVIDIVVGETTGVSLETKVVVDHSVSNPNQHTIGAITGLREELDEIKRVKPVYADKINVANYYKWNNSTYNSHGHFVSLVNGDSSIEICRGSNIFGVTVDSAGFIGGQDESNPRDLSYGLIATFGTVDVLCELDGEVGDCVTSNTRGYATKSGSDYGYKVIARENKNGSEYAVIMLGVQADTTNALGEELDNIEKRVGINETNILSAINVANQAYSKADDTNVSNQAISDKVDNALNIVGKVELDMENLENQVSNSSLISTQARAIAESAATAAESMRKEAIDSANDAVSKVGELTKTLEPLTTWEDPATGNSGASYLVNYIDNGLATKAEIETVEGDLGHATSAIQQNAKSLQSLVISIDKYSVGEYSQANGLTQEQATNILEDGLIYVPTKQHEESSYSEESPRTFTPGYLYQWGELSSGLHGWTTVDKDYAPITESEGDAHSEINTSSMAVYFSHVEIVIGGNNNYGYWYTDGDEIESVSGAIYEPYTLYKWETDHWLAVATLKGNANNRAISMLNQTANSISAEVTNARGDFASLDARINDEISQVSMVATKLLDNGEINAAAIVASVNDSESNVAINANKIVLSGDTFFVDKDGNTTTIDGSHITAGTVTANYIDSVSGNIGGFKIGEKAIYNEYDVSDIADANNGSLDKLYMTSYDKLNQQSSLWDYYLTDENKNQINRDYVYVGTDGIGTYRINTTSFGSITDALQTYMADGKLFSNNAEISGNITAISGYIGDKSGGFIIDSSAIRHGKGSYQDYIDGVYIGTNGIGLGSGKFYVTSAGKLYANDVDIKGKITATSGEFTGTITANDGGSVGGWSISDGTLTRTAADESYGGAIWTLSDNIRLTHNLDGNPITFLDFGWSYGSEIDNGTIYPYYGFVTNSNLAFKVGSNRRGVLSGTWEFDTGEVVTSCRLAKHDIEPLDDRYSVLFDNIEPVRFKYNNGQSNRYHTGFILDELKDAMDEASIDSSEFAAYCVNDEQTGEGGIRYEEIIALLVKEVQELKKEIKEIKGNE